MLTFINVASVTTLWSEPDSPLTNLANMDCSVATVLLCCQGGSLGVDMCRNACLLSVTSDVKSRLHLQ